MVSRKITLIMAMLVLAVFAVGSVSAAENVTTDMEVSTEEMEIDDSVVEEVQMEDVNDEVDDNSGNLRSGTYIINIGDNTTVINEAIENYSYVIFTAGTYNDIYNVTLQNDTVVDGNGSTIIGNGVDDIFLVIDCRNVTIKNFVLNVNGAKHGINGSYVKNSVFDNNEIYNAKDGININHVYDNLTVINNYIHNITRDGISLVNHNILDNLDNVNNSIVSNNRVSGGEIGLFFGGNFKGTISNNGIYSCEYGMQFIGKPIGNISKIYAIISDNGIFDVESGIYFENETAVSLNILNNEIHTLDYFNNYTVDYGQNFSKAENISINFYYNVLSGSIKQSLINMTYVFNNWFDGYIHLDE